MIPNRLTEWTYEIVQNLCSAGRSESDRHDFKFGLQDPKSTTKLCCAFANSEGGFLIVGVKQENNNTKQFLPEGIEPDKELYGKLISKIRADPSINIALPNIINVPDSHKTIYVFEIPQSTRRPHLPTPKDERFFWKREGSDCVRMTLEEVRYQMNHYEEKREKLTLLVIELDQILQIINADAQTNENQYNGEDLSFDVIDRIIVETFSFLREDMNIIANLNALKRKVSMLRTKKQLMFRIIAAKLAMPLQSGGVPEYRSFATEQQPHVFQLVQNIKDALKERFGIENPYQI